MEKISKTFRLTTTFAKFEFWAFTTLFAFVMVFFFWDGFDKGNSAYQDVFNQAGIPFNFYRNFFIPQLIRNIALFVSLMYLNFVVVPRLANRRRLLLNFFLLLLVFLLLATVLGITDYPMRTFFYGKIETGVLQQMALNGLDQAFVTVSVFAIYTVIKYVNLYLLKVSEKLETKYRFIRREGIVAGFIWAVVLLFLINESAPGLAVAAWVIAVPSAILLYLAGFYVLIPSSLNKKYSFLLYWGKNALILFIILMAWGLIIKLVVGGVLRGDKAPLAALWIFNSVLQLFVTVPVTWWLYKRHIKGNEQVNLLKKELGQSAASFDFLRSQINPHFLFNALNTLYGTALQEGAEKTGEGVQKLGDMMRFMLQENMQERISLSREVEYLHNYIDLQKLRTDATSTVRIETDIQDSNTAYPIAPMLLIPFVENAFKHGISFRELSLIKISLAVKNSTLHFHVFNLKHQRHDNDPEKDKSGIGLENVKQRLQLLYPRRHELSIHNTAENFSVYLTVELAKFTVA